MNRLALIALAAVAVPTVAGADEIDNWSFGGYLDFYYSKDLNHIDTGYGNVLRKFDIFNKDPKIAAGEIQIARKATRDLPLGLHVDLLFGRNADVLNKWEPGGENRWKNLRQAYVSYENDRFSLDFGKFGSMMGVESSVSGNNVNYSTGFVKMLTQPSYHYGGRIKLALNDRTTLGFYGVNGWNEVEDSGDDLSFGGWLKYDSDKWGLKIGAYSGDEGSEDAEIMGLGYDGEKIDTQVIDFTLKYMGIPRWKWMVNGTFGTLEADGDEYEFNGIAAYGQYKINDTWNLGLRAEQVEDEGGIRTLPHYYGSMSKADGLSSDFKLSSLTLNFDHHTSDKSMIRFEIRSDKADESIFIDNDGSTDKRVTYSLSWFIRW